MKQIILLALLGSSLLYVGCRSTGDERKQTRVYLTKCIGCFVIVKEVREDKTIKNNQGKVVPTDIGSGASIAAGPAAVSGPGNSEKSTTESIILRDLKGNKWWNSENTLELTPEDLMIIDDSSQQLDLNQWK